MSQTAFKSKPNTKESKRDNACRNVLFFADSTPRPIRESTVSSQFSAPPYIRLVFSQLYIWTWAGSVKVALIATAASAALGGYGRRSYPKS